MRLLGALLACLWLVVGAIAANDAVASFGIAGFDGESTADEAGNPYTQAGGHPFEATTTIDFNQTVDSNGFAVPDESIRQMRVDLPPGFIGNPQATPTRCTEAELAGGEPISIGICPASSQVGTSTVNLGEFGILTFPVFNMVPTKNEPAQLGIRVLTTDFHIDTKVTTEGDEDKVTAFLNDVSNALPLIGTELTLWGVPADSRHDSQRGPCGDPFGSGGLCPTDAPPVPFVTLPTACTPPGVGLETHLQAESWPGSVDSASFFSHLPPGLPTPGPQQGPTGCDSVPFNPSISIKPTRTAADTPTGLHVELKVPPAGLLVSGGIGSSHLRNARVSLPTGMTVNPASAAGLQACSSAQARLDAEGESQCPDAAKIGSFEVETPLLEDPLDGSVYLAAQGDNPFSSLLAIYLVAKGPGIDLKLAGHVDADPATGRLVTTFENNPQLPFSTLRVDLFGGAGAPLRTPSSCGAYTSDAELTPWSGGPAVPLSSGFQITSGPHGTPCAPAAFAPKLKAGSVNPVAGRYSPLLLELSREDGEQELTSVDLEMPRGLLGKLAGIPYCSDSAIASIPTLEGTGRGQLTHSTCPAASQIGTSPVAVGAGPSPLFVDTGRVYLAGPYRGAPLSLAIVAPAVTGPFDLGNVVVRTALRVDPETAQVEAVSDPIPTIVHGIPLDLRSVRVIADRPDFALNPTSCSPKAFDGTAGSPAGTTAPLEERYQVGSCASLGFAPKLRFSLSGPTHRGGHPRLTAVLTARKGDANIARAIVALPHSEFLDQSHIGTVCTRVQFAAHQCPAASIYGFAKASTPLLERALRGPVYLRSSSHKLPDLVADLGGQIDVTLDGRIDSVHGGIRTTFEAVPDAPVSKFTLQMRGGRRGLLENSTDLCAGPHRATVNMHAQNGRLRKLRPAMKAQCTKHRAPRRHASPLAVNHR